MLRTRSAAWVKQSALGFSFECEALAFDVDGDRLLYQTIRASRWRLPRRRRPVAGIELSRALNSTTVREGARQ